MLLKFRFENFRSFAEEQVLSFAATKDSPKDPRLLHVKAIPSAILPAIAIYGVGRSDRRWR